MPTRCLASRWLHALPLAGVVAVLTVTLPAPGARAHPAQPGAKAPKAKPPAPKKVDRDKARLDKGEIIVRTRKVKGSDMPAAHVRAVIHAPPAKIWSILAFCDRYTKTMQRVKESKELSRKGNVVLCKVVVDMPWPVSDLSAVTRAVHTVRKGTYYQRKWSLVKGDYKRNRGSWTLTPYDDAGKQTLVVYRAHAEPNISVPTWIQKAAAKSTFPKLIRHLRKQVGDPR